MNTPLKVKSKWGRTLDEGECELNMEVCGGIIYKSRVTMVLGWLSASELYQKKTDNDYEIDTRVYESIKKYYCEKTWFWGESATPFFIMMSNLIFEHGDESFSNRIICDLILDIAFENFREGKGIPDPYFSSNDIISYVYELPEVEIEMRSFLGSSYHLESLVDILLRRNRRNLLNELWKWISYLQKCEFRPDQPWKMFLWRCFEGEEVETFYKNPQSWKELYNEAKAINNSTLPNILLNNPYFLFILFKLNGKKKNIIYGIFGYISFFI